MVNEFIHDLKNSSYYGKLFERPNVLAIYISGSVCAGTTDDRSDYDIDIFTLDGDHIDESKYEYLMYKGRKVHWYYFPICELFNPKCTGLNLLGPILLRNFSKDLVIYENPKYIDELNKLYSVKDTISLMAIYNLFNEHKTYIEEVLRAGAILEKHHTKYLYHLCLASYYLANEPLDKEFLRVIKRIRWQPVSNKYKALAIERLKIYKNYIETNPVNTEDTLSKLREQAGIFTQKQVRGVDVY